MKIILSTSNIFISKSIKCPNLFDDGQLLVISKGIVFFLVTIACSTGSLGAHTEVDKYLLQLINNTFIISIHYLTIIIFFMNSGNKKIQRSIIEYTDITIIIETTTHKPPHKPHFHDEWIFEDRLHVLCLLALISMTA